MTNVWTTHAFPPPLTRIPRIPGDRHRFPRNPGNSTHFPRMLGETVGRVAREGRRRYFQRVDRMKPAMMKPKPMPTFTRPLADPPMEFITGISEPAT